MRKWLLFFIVIAGVYAFQAYSDFEKQVVNNFMTLVRDLPHEKVYLHTDKSAYTVGENIWFRVHGVHALINTPEIPSQFVYVDLVDKRDSLIQRVKIGPRDSCFYGQLALPQMLPQGEYCLRAYTYNLQQQGSEWIFKKKIRVINPRDSKVWTEISYRKTKRGEHVAEIKFLDNDGKPYEYVPVLYCVGDNGKRVVDKRGFTNKNGILEVKVDSSNQVIRLTFDDQGPFQFNRYIRVPELTDDFDVQFMPEGGSLLVGNWQRVAFKAIGADGHSLHVTGELYQDSTRLMTIESVHNGMGSFQIPVNWGRRFRALLKTEDGRERWFELPESNLAGWGVSVEKRGDMVEYCVMKGEDTELEGELYVLVHSCGMVFDIQRVNGPVRGKINIESLPEGISQVVLMNGEGKVYSQRQFFVKHTGLPELNVMADKSRYVARERVELSIGLEEIEGLQGGVFSIAVTDDGKVQQDSLEENILSNLLLTSYLKGHVENPGYYFNESNSEVEEYMDLVMLTHGWTRFDAGKVIRGEFPRVKYEIEVGQVISGQVVNFWGKESKGANVVLLSDGGIYKLLETDEKGRFWVDDIMYDDTTRFLMRALNAKGRRNVEVVIDQDQLLPPYYDLPNTIGEKMEDEEFLKKYGVNYYYENGQKIYVLDEVMVARKKISKSFSFYDRLAYYRLDSTALAGITNKDISQIIQEIPGVYWGKDTVGEDCVLRFGKQVCVMVDEFEEPMYLVKAIPVDMLLGIAMLEPMYGQFLYGQRGENGVLIITTKSGFTPKTKRRFNIKSFKLLGYQTPEEFYVPRYDVDSVRRDNRYDERTTIYWNPVVRVEPGKQEKVMFYTADTYGTYSVIVEGVTRNGVVLRKKVKLKL